MASSHSTAIVIVTLLLLASSQSLVHARMAPRDQPHVHAVQSPSTSTASSAVSQDLLQVFAALPAPTPVMVPTDDKPEIATANGRQIIEVVNADGSVPSPGVGHHH